MKKILIILLIGLASAGGWMLFNRIPAEDGPVSQGPKDIYYCPMHPQYTSDRPGDCPICYMKLVKKETPRQEMFQSSGEKRILYWTDPMIPGYKADGPGKSPMGMDLVPVYDESAVQKAFVPGYSAVAMDTQKQQLIGVKTTTVVRKPLVKTIRAYGYVAHDLELYNAQLEYITAWHEYYAVVIRRPVQEDYKPDWWNYYVTEPSGSRFRSDDKLKVQQRLLKVEYELRHMGINDTQLAKLREVKKGQPWVQPDLLFFQEGHPVWVYAQILETDLGYVDVGQQAIVTIPTYGEKTEGIVRNVSLMVEPETRTTLVRIELPKYPGELKVNMYVDVDFPVELNPSLLVPREAVMDTGLKKVVFVKTQEGIFEPRIIETGFEGDGMVAVKSGLKEGETIVSAGNFLLDSESRIMAGLEGTPTGESQVSAESGGEHVH